MAKVDDEVKGLRARVDVLEATVARLEATIARLSPPPVAPPDPRGAASCARLDHVEAQLTEHAAVAARNRIVA